MTLRDGASAPPQDGATAPKKDVTKEDLVNVTIDGIQVAVPKDTLVIRAAEQVGVQIPRFCDHPLLAPVGACRQCLVDVPDAGNGRGFPKPQASCTLPVAEGMVVNSQVTSPVADKAQQGVMEFLLINHPLDCPVCDKGGECPLQNQAMSNGRGDSRFSGDTAEGTKRTFPKPINLSPIVLLDRERCIVCQRCTRFADEIAGDPFIEMIERGAQQQVGIAPSSTGDASGFTSYFSGNTIQICPVGALTSEAYRFRSRPFDLVSSQAVAEHDACGSAIRLDHRRGKVMRRQAGDDPAVNEEWITDKDRFAFAYAHGDDRITYPQIRGADGDLRPASWPEAFAVAARGLAAAQVAGGVGVLTGGRLTAEDAYAYGKFARVALRTNDVDFRARPLSAEETAFLAAHVVLTAPDGGGVTYDDLESASKVVLVGLEPEDEAGAIWLRLRKAVRAGRTQVIALAPYTTRGLRKLSGRLVPTVPGTEPEAIRSLLEQSEYGVDSAAVVLVGERLAAVPGALTAAAELAAKSGARLAWVPRRAGDRGAVEAGCLPNLLPGGRPVADASARVDVATAWGVDALPEAEGRDADGIVAALNAGELGGSGHRRRRPGRHRRPGCDARRHRGRRLRRRARPPRDRRDPRCRRRAAGRAGQRQGRHVRQLGRAGAPVRGRAPQPVLAPGPADPRRHRRGTEFDFWGSPARLPLRPGGARGDDAAGALGRRASALVEARCARTSTSERQDAEGLVLATWKQSIDNGRMQDGDKYLKATARPVVALVSQAVYDEHGPTVTLTGDRGRVTLPAEVADDLVDGVVWVPANSFGAGVLSDLASPGSRVRVEGGQT